jgi:hypothetical protein
VVSSQNKPNVKRLTLKTQVNVRVIAVASQQTVDALSRECPRLQLVRLLAAAGGEVDVPPGFEDVINLDVDCGMEVEDTWGEDE